MEFIDSQSVIEEVKKFPCLYDPNDKSFRNRDVRKDAWTVATIAIVGLENWEVMEDRDKEGTGKLVGVVVEFVRFWGDFFLVWLLAFVHKMASERYTLAVVRERPVKCGK